jgi:hypothetical protein
MTAQEQILIGGLFGSTWIQQDEGALARLDRFQDALSFRWVGHGYALILDQQPDLLHLTFIEQSWIVILWFVASRCG